MGTVPKRPTFRRVTGRVAFLVVGNDYAELIRKADEFVVRFFGREVPVRLDIEANGGMYQAKDCPKWRADCVAVDE